MPSSDLAYSDKRGEASLNEDDVIESAVIQAKPTELVRRSVPTGALERENTNRARVKSVSTYYDVDANDHQSHIVWDSLEEGEIVDAPTIESPNPPVK